LGGRGDDKALQCHQAQGRGAAGAGAEIVADRTRGDSHPRIKRPR
jgi:hypothetical protein